MGKIERIQLTSLNREGWLKITQKIQLKFSTENDRNVTKRVNVALNLI